MPPQLLRELDGVLAVGVGVVRQQGGSAAPGRLRLGLAVTALMAEIRSWRSQLLMIGVSSLGGDCVADRRGEHEARLVEEHRVRLPTLGLADDLEQFLRPQWSIATSSRTLTRRSGFWLVQ